MSAVPVDAYMRTRVGYKLMTMPEEEPRLSGYTPKTLARISRRFVAVERMTEIVSAQNRAVRDWESALRSSRAWAKQREQERRLAKNEKARQKYAAPMTVREFQAPAPVKPTKPVTVPRPQPPRNPELEAAKFRLLRANEEWRGARLRSEYQWSDEVFAAHAALMAAYEAYYGAMAGTR